LLVRDEIKPARFTSCFQRGAPRRGGVPSSIASSCGERSVCVCSSITRAVLASRAGRYFLRVSGVSADATIYMSRIHESWLAPIA